MKKGKMIISIAILTVLIGSVITIWLCRLDKDDDSEAIDNSFYIHFYSGDITIKIKKDLLNKVNQNIPNYFIVKGGPLEFNESKIKIIIEKYLSEPKLSSSSDVDRLYYGKKNDSLLIEIGGALSYFNNNLTDIISPDETISDDNLEKIALEYIKNNRGNNSDLKMESIQKSAVLKGNISSKKETLIGIESQQIIFRQYIDGFKVGGARGEVIVNIGKDGILKFYKDSTIYIDIGSKIEYNFQMNNISSILSNKKNVVIYGDDDTYEIIDCAIILNAYDFYSQDVKLSWEITLKSEDGDILKQII